MTLNRKRYCESFFFADVFVLFLSKKEKRIKFVLFEVIRFLNQIMKFRTRVISGG